jgi:hypothetical protein
LISAGGIQNLLIDDVEIWSWVSALYALLRRPADLEILKLILQITIIDIQVTSRGIPLNHMMILNYNSIRGLLCGFAVDKSREIRAYVLAHFDGETPCEINSEIYILLHLLSSGE